MDALGPGEVRRKKAQAQALAATLHVGKSGVTDATLAELDAQLKKHKLVKVKLLPASLQDAGLQAQAETLAAGTRSHLVEVRGRTAVYFRP